MKDIFRVELTRKKVILILNSFVQGGMLADELKRWVIWVMNVKERDGLLNYDASVGDVIFSSWS